MGTNELNGKPIYMPEVTQLDEVLTILGPWEKFENKTPHERTTKHADYIGQNQIGPYCTIKRVNDNGTGHTRTSVAAKLTPAALEVLFKRIVTTDDHLSFEVIEHKGTGKALVIVQHNHIIGSIWMAYVDASSIPEEVV